MRMDTEEIDNVLMVENNPIGKDMYVKTVRLNINKKK